MDRFAELLSERLERCDQVIRAKHRELALSGGEAAALKEEDEPVAGMLSSDREVTETGAVNQHALSWRVDLIYYSVNGAPQTCRRLRQALDVLAKEGAACSFESYSRPRYSVGQE